MSRPENPLSQYYTYSYHHILMACNNTVTAEALQNSNQLITYMRDETQVNTDTDPFGRYNPRNVPFGSKNGSEIGKYSIIINGMTDAEFVITKANWTNITAADAGSNGADRFTTMTAEGAMTIEEPRGIRFMNVMSEVANKLETDPSGIVFVLKTIFTGYTADNVSFGIDDKSRVQTSSRLEGAEVYDPITNIRPLLFLMYDITGEFKVTGGTYVISFVGLSNGATKQKHIMTAADQISINFGAKEDRSLASGLSKLQREINEQYETYYQDIKKRVESTVDSKGNKTKFRGRKVQYIILAEEPYVRNFSVSSDGKVSFTPNDEYTITDFKVQNTDKGKKDEGGIISFGKSKSVESAIMMIVNRCKKIKDEAANKDNKELGTDTKFVPKVVSAIISDNDTFKVVYKLRRLMEARSDVIEKVLKRSPDDNKSNQDDDIVRNKLELDYFYTGQNTDIINFDIKMEMGLAFFQTLVTTDNLSDSQDSAKGQSPKSKNVSDECLSRKNTGNKEAKEKDSEPLQNVRPNTPIYFSTKFNKASAKNTTDPALTASFQQMLNRHAALENLEAKVTIHGNSGLLNAVNKSPSEILRHSNRLQSEADKQRDLFPYWETTPAIVKLNIKMPGDDNDLDFSVPFWYEGFYYCFSIEHNFDNGEFTQVLDMISLPQSTPTCEPNNKSKNETNQESQTDKNKTASTSDASTGAGTSSAGAAGTGSSAAQTTTQTNTQIVQTSDTPADVEPEKLQASDYLKAFFKDQIVPGCDT